MFCVEVFRPYKMMCRRVDASGVLRKQLRSAWGGMFREAVGEWLKKTKEDNF